VTNYHKEREEQHKKAERMFNELIPEPSKFSTDFSNYYNGFFGNITVETIKELENL
jgi:hypothetical protein